MENDGEEWAKQGMEAFTFFSMAPVPTPSFCGTWGPAQSPGQKAGGLCLPVTRANSRLMPAGKERDESKSGLRKTRGKTGSKGNLFYFGFWYWEEGRRGHEGYQFSLTLADFQEDTLGCGVVGQRSVVESVGSCPSHFML